MDNLLAGESISFLLTMSHIVVDCFINLIEDWSLASTVSNKIAAVLPDAPEFRLIFNAGNVLVFTCSCALGLVVPMPTLPPPDCKIKLFQALVPADNACSELYVFPDDAPCTIRNIEPVFVASTQSLVVNLAPPALPLVHCTCNLSSGAVVPMPTLPLPLITMVSTIVAASPLVLERNLMSALSSFLRESK